MKPNGDASEDENRSGTGASRVLWFVALWCAGVATVGVIAYAIRLVIGV